MEEGVEQVIELRKNGYSLAEIYHTVDMGYEKVIAVCQNNGLGGNGIYGDVMRFVYPVVEDYINSLDGRPTHVDRRDIFDALEVKDNSMFESLWKTRRVRLVTVIGICLKLFGYSKGRGRGNTYLYVGD